MCSVDYVRYRITANAIPHRRHNPQEFLFVIGVKTICCFPAYIKSLCFLRRISFFFRAPAPYHPSAIHPMLSEIFDWLRLFFFLFQDSRYYFSHFAYSPVCSYSIFLPRLPAKPLVPFITYTVFLQMSSFSSLTFVQYSKSKLGMSIILLLSIPQF